MDVSRMLEKRTEEADKRNSERLTNTVNKEAKIIKEDHYNNICLGTENR